MKSLFTCAVVAAALAALGVAGCGETSSGSPVATSGASTAAAEAPLVVEPRANAAADAKALAAARPTEIVHKAPQEVARGGDGRARNITFDALKFPMEDPKSREFKAEFLTDSIEKLGGTRIRIRGFMLPVPVDEVSQFVLVRDDQECCFGPGAAIYDSVMVNMEEGKTARFGTKPVTVEGEFRVREVIGPDKKHWSIYHITATKVE